MEVERGLEIAIGFDVVFARRLAGVFGFLVLACISSSDSTTVLLGAIII